MPPSSNAIVLPLHRPRKPRSRLHPRQRFLPHRLHRPTPALHTLTRSFPQSIGAGFKPALFALITSESALASASASTHSKNDSNVALPVYPDEPGEPSAAPCGDAGASASKAKRKKTRENCGICFLSVRTGGFLLVCVLIESEPARITVGSQAFGDPCPPTNSAGSSAATRPPREGSSVSATTGSLRASANQPGAAPSPLRTPTARHWPRAARPARHPACALGSGLSYERWLAPPLLWGYYRVYVCASLAQFLPFLSP